MSPNTGDTDGASDRCGGVRFGLPKFAPGAQQKEAGTLNAIWSIAFAPGGDRVALGGSDGSIWLWDLQKKTVRLVGEHPGRGDDNQPGPFRKRVKGQPARLNEVRLLTFTGRQTLVSVAADGWMLEWDTAAKDTTPRTLFYFKKARNLECVAIDPTKQWVAAGGQTLAQGEESSSVEVRSIDGRPQVKRSSAAATGSIASATRATALRSGSDDAGSGCERAEANGEPPS